MSDFKAIRAFFGCLALVGLLSLVPFSSHAETPNTTQKTTGASSQTASGDTSDQCNITTRVGCSPASGALMTTAPCNATATRPCDAVRSDPSATQTTIPIDAHNICRYVDNAATSGRSIFVPFASPTEWSGFIGHVGPNTTNSYITLSTCARSDTIAVPDNYPTYPDGTKNNFYVAAAAPNDMTCDSAKMTNINLPYARTGATLQTGVNLPAVSFTCTVAGYSCYMSGPQKGTCGNNLTWSETANATFTAGTAPDGLPTPSGWSLSGVTYSGGPKPVPQSGCAATTLNWTVDGLTCSGPTNTVVANGSSTTVTSTNANSGVATFDCPTTSTTFSATPESGATCTAPLTCGSADSTTSVTQPTTGLCSDGSTPPVTLSSDSNWQWSCGTNSCSATQCPSGQSYFPTAFNLTVGVTQTIPFAYEKCEYGLLSGGINKGSTTTDGNTTMRCQPGCYPGVPPGGYSSPAVGACGTWNGYNGEVNANNGCFTSAVNSNYTFCASGTETGLSCTGGRVGTVSSCSCSWTCQGTSTAQGTSTSQTCRASSTSMN